MRRFRFSSCVVLLLLVTVCSLFAQERAVTLRLQGGSSFACTVTDVWKGQIYFEARTAKDAFTYGEVIALEKIVAVRLADGRELSPEAYVAQWRKEETGPPTQPVTPPAQTTPPPPGAPPPKVAPPASHLPRPELFPTTPVQTSTVNATLDTTRRRYLIGLGWLEPPRPPLTASVDYIQIADLLAASGLAGRLLYQVGSGELRGRELAPSQRRLIEALLQSRTWASRKAELRQAHLQAHEGYQRLRQDDPARLRREFQFQPERESHGFLEFVQFLHAENAHLFTDKWHKVENVFPPQAAKALQDILANYDDWYYLYGQEVEKP
ncbi:MAG: hypothetical protein ONB48_13760 [candidate division KSB1 bacterium]|nr:hypothetical protein [candidate division KSB1 bacterium]MDZ7276503.1 hypothetical protein [candidate division KSB1 bacterium]MDZ7286716.1 hypothetical protein [candidate division KSB1 bacterium]MDZ7300273.1 hypothetical protein [candidate division KSB1 bacterium]MDZ7309403.1 hypothetical protein [candidate division KSB1 bacterium]